MDINIGETIVIHITDGETITGKVTDIRTNSPGNQVIEIVEEESSTFLRDRL
jgi:hypothetical protein